MLKELETPCPNGRADFYMDSKCKRSCCISCIVDSEYKTDDIQLDRYGVELLYNAVNPLDFVSR